MMESFITHFFQTYMEDNISCFIVENEQIDCIITARLSGRDTELSKIGDKTLCNELTEIGHMLLDENVKAFNIRYSHNPVQKVDYEFHMRPCDPLQALKYILCLKYQYSEYADCDRSQAWMWLSEAEDCIIHKLPGYDECNWSYS